MASRTLLISMHLGSYGFVANMSPLAHENSRWPNKPKPLIDQSKSKNLKAVAEEPEQGESDT